MNIKTTLGLLVLAGLGVLLFLKGPALGPKLGLAPPPVETPDLGTAAVLASEITRDQLKRVELRPKPDADLLVLESPALGQWALPGNWPLRQAEADELLDRLAHLHTRFRPVPVAADTDLKPYGLAADQSPVSVLVQTAAGKTYRLQFGRPETSLIDDPFAQPTYVRLDDRAELLRLGPDLLDVLRRPREDYQRRQLFPQVERVTLADAAPAGRQPGPEGLAVLPDAAAVSVRGPAGAYELARSQPLRAAEAGGDAGLPLDRLADAWTLRAPVEDRADPAKLRAALAAVPELWVERFLPPGDKLPHLEPGPDISPFAAWLGFATTVTDLVAHGPAEALRAERWLPRWTGLDHPVRTVQVTPPGGEPLTLQIGRVSRVKTVPAVGPGGIEGREEYRFARLGDNPQLFEVRTDRFADLFVTAKDLRDPQLVRFKPADARKVELAHGSERAVLERGGKDEPWRLVEPIRGLADAGKVNDLLERLAGLRATGEDIIDPKGPDDLKRTGLEPPAETLTLTYQPEARGTRPPRSVTFAFGKVEEKAPVPAPPDPTEPDFLRRDKKAKLYVRTSDRPRINAVDDAPAAPPPPAPGMPPTPPKGGEALSKLVARPAGDFRGKRLLDFLPAQVAEVAVHRGGEDYQLHQTTPGNWSLRLGSPADLSADQGKASRLADELSRLEVVEYVEPAEAKNPADLGLNPPALSATVRFYDPNRKPQTVLVGKQRPGKAGSFAKLADAPDVFAVSADLHAALDESSLAYRPLQLWQSTPADLTAIGVQRRDGPYELKHAGGAWRVEGPFSAPADRAGVEPVAAALAAPRAERYEVHKATDLKAYGLDNPTLKLTVTAPERKPDGSAGPAREHTLLVGNPTVPEPTGHFARLADGDAVFVVGPGILAADKPALDLLDRRLLATDDAFGPPELQGFQSPNATAGPVKLARAGDAWTVELGGAPVPADRERVAGLQRLFGRLEALRFAAYGPPPADLAKFGLNPPAQTVTATLAPSGGPAAAHTLALGKPVESNPGERYARLDNGPGVAVLSAAVVADLTRPALDYADRTLLKFDASELSRIDRKGAAGELELTRAVEGWKLVKPLALPADQTTLEELADRLASLWALKVVAWGATDLKPFGLDAPAAVIELQAGTAKKVLKIGKPVEGADGDRFALVEGGPAVGVLSGALAKRLLAEPIQFRDHTLATVRAEIDKAQLERGERKATFTKADDVWKMTEPVAADAEQADLDAFVNRLAKLRADEFVADKPTDLKPYGLDRPAVQWHLSAGGKEVLALLVGGKEKDGPRRYAKLASGELVFLLDPATTTRAEAEYRKRSPGPTVDASQVEALAVSGPGGSFVLRKLGPAWVVQGMPDRRVDTERVNEALGTLATLRVERYVLDKGADPKLFGLDPAQRTLVATSRTGVFTLQLGTREGDSQRVYAHVPGPGRSDVFTLSEADAAKLNRDLTAFAPAK